MRNQTCRVNPPFHCRKQKAEAFVITDFGHSSDLLKVNFHIFNDIGIWRLLQSCHLQLKNLRLYRVDNLLFATPCFLHLRCLADNFLCQLRFLLLNHLKRRIGEHRLFKLLLFGQTIIRAFAWDQVVHIKQIPRDNRHHKNHRAGDLAQPAFFAKHADDDSNHRPDITCQQNVCPVH